MHRPRQSLSAALDARENNIGALRLLLAMLVLCFHCYPIGGYGAEPLYWLSHHQLSTGGVAVEGFFFLSGLLITGSYDRASSLWRFLWQRVLRIFPGYWVCLLVVAFGFGPLICIIERGTLAGYFTLASNGPITYLRENGLLSYKQEGINDLLAHVPHPYGIDGSIWTLGNEFTCYLMIAVLGITQILRRRPLLVLVLLAGLLLIATQAHFALTFGPTQLILIIFPSYGLAAQALYFTIGACCYLFRDHIPLHPIIALSLLAVLIGTLWTPASGYVLMLALPYLLLYTAFAVPPLRIDRYGDFSYGVYIYAYPVQETLTLLGLNHQPLVLYLLLTLLGTAPLAILSWAYVERPALKLKKLQLVPSRKLDLATG